MYEWNIPVLIDAVIADMPQGATLSAPQRQALQQAMGDVLNRVYYDYSNLGQTSSDRALNYTVTNGIQVALAIANALSWTDQNGNLQFPEIAAIQTAKSKFCRIDSDCIDVKIKLFNPGNIYQSWMVGQFTVDVSDALPVTVGLPRTWREPPGS